MPAMKDGANSALDQLGGCENKMVKQSCLK